MTLHKTLATLVLAIACTACQKEEAPAAPAAPEPTTTAAPAPPTSPARSAAPAAPTPPATAPAATALELKSVTDAEYGYEIEVPKDAALRKTSFRDVWAWTYAGGRSSYTVAISEEEPPADAKAARAQVATVRAAKSIASATAIDGGFRVEMAAQADVPTRELFVFKKGATKTLMARCEGTSFAELGRMCGSLKATR
jgi:hypothetical protein